MALTPFIEKLVSVYVAGLKGPAGMANVHAWVGLNDLVGVRMPAKSVLSNAASMHRDETLFTLARIAADLANSPGGVLGATARSWTRDLLVQRMTSRDPYEAAISQAVAALADERAIAHAHVIFFLQVMLVARGGRDGQIPTDGYLAFMMLAANDYIPEWPKDDAFPLTQTERSVAPMFLSSIFNRADDVMRSLLRLIDIMGRYPRRDFPVRARWEAVQMEAFGTSFERYAEMFLTPIYLLARAWGDGNVPIIFPQEFAGHCEADTALYQRWFREASITIDDAVVAFGARPLPSGLLGLPPTFFRTPFIDFGDKLVGLSPWHVRDHAVLGTWGKLNDACKRVLGTRSNQTFASAFGYCFEEWCGDLAREAAASPAFCDQLILPSHPGADDEIEDVVLLDGDLVGLFSAKASLVPEAHLKTAESYSDVIAWLRRFFFEEPSEAKKTGYRGGAVQLLDKKIRKIRAGAFENRGLRRDAIIIPAVVCFDNVGESGILYKWLEEECSARGLLEGVRPLTVITPEDYEGLLALGAAGHGICKLLMRKTELSRHWGPLDQFLHGLVDDSIELRLPSMKARFNSLVNRSVARLRDVRKGGPTEQEISEAAYYRWLARGATHGADREDWYEAERALRGM